MRRPAIGARMSHDYPPDPAVTGYDVLFGLASEPEIVSRLLPLSNFINHLNN
jgi:hypothetical protein